MSYTQPHQPPGILPYPIWAKFFPDGPTIQALTQRYEELLAVVERCRKGGWEPRVEWLRELGVQP